MNKMPIRLSNELFDDKIFPDTPWWTSENMDSIKSAGGFQISRGDIRIFIPTSTSIMRHIKDPNHITSIHSSLFNIETQLQILIKSCIDSFYEKIDTKKQTADEYSARKIELTRSVICVVDNFAPKSLPKLRVGQLWCILHNDNGIQLTSIVTILSIVSTKDKSGNYEKSLVFSNPLNVIESESDFLNMINSVECESAFLIHPTIWSKKTGIQYSFDDKNSERKE